MEEKSKVPFVVIVILILAISGLQFYKIDNKREESADEEPLAEEIDYREVIFDRNKGVFWDIWNTGSMGYSLAAQHLRDLGYKVSQNNIPLEKRVTEMDDNDVLILPPAPSSTSTYSDEEINEIKEFIKEGGGVLVLGEHDDFEGMASYQNELLNEFGLNIKHDMGFQYEDNLGNNNWIGVNSSFFGLEKLSMYGAASIQLFNDSDLLASAPKANFATSSSTVGGKAEYGKGKVICLGDTHTFWNGKKDWGIRYGNNSKFLTKIVNYLSGMEKTKKDGIEAEYELFTTNYFNLTITAEGGVDSFIIKGGSVKGSNSVGEKTRYRITVEKDGYAIFNSSGNREIVYFFKPKSDHEDHGKEQKKILFDTSHGARGVHNTPSGLYRFARSLKEKGHHVFASEKGDYSSFDEIIISNPLSEYSKKEVDDITENTGDLILLGERRTSTLAQDLGVYEDIKKFGWDERISPINQLTSRSGVNLTWYTITDTSGEDFSPKVLYEGKELQLHGSGTLEVEREEDFSMSKTASDSWGEETAWERWHLNYNSTDLKGPVTYCVRIESIFVMGDSSPFENQNYVENEWFARYISEWMIR